MNEAINFSADKVKIHGPKVDGGFTVSLEVGEYEQRAVAKLLMLPQNGIVQVTIEQAEGET